MRSLVAAVPVTLARRRVLVFEVADGLVGSPRAPGDANDSLASLCSRATFDAGGVCTPCGNGRAAQCARISLLRSVEGVEEAVDNFEPAVAREAFASSLRVFESSETRDGTADAADSQLLALSLRKNAVLKGSITRGDAYELSHSLLVATGLEASWW